VVVVYEVVEVGCCKLNDNGERAIKLAALRRLGRNTSYKSFPARFRPAFEVGR
jgi:hypothetical protein